MLTAGKTALTDNQTGKTLNDLPDSTKAPAWIIFSLPIAKNQAYYPNMDKSLALRWETAQRYYAAYLHRDLWGEVVLTRAWGGRGSRLGNVHTDHLQPDQVDAVLADLAKRRAQHKYQPANEETAQLMARLSSKGEQCDSPS